MSVNSTGEENQISEFLGIHKDEIESIDPQRSALTLTRNEDLWNPNDVPKKIPESICSFFRYPALVTERKFQFSKFENPDFENIPSDYLQFPSNTETQLQNSLSDQLKKNEPISSIIAPKAVPEYIDPYPNFPIVDEPRLEYVTFQFDQLISKVEVIEPVVFSMYVFDSALGKRVSKQWFFMSNQLKDSLLSNPNFEFLKNEPTSASFNIQRPKVREGPQENTFAQMFLMILFNRPITPKAGAAINAFYEKVNEGNKKKALAALKETYSDNALLTFAYAAMPVAEALTTLNTAGPENECTLNFSTVIATDNADEDFLQHKLNKKRKHPINFPFSILLKAKYGKTGQVMDHMYPFDPVFSLKFENKMIIKLKSLEFSIMNKLKSKNVYIIAEFFERDILKNGVFQGKSSFKSFCQFHQSEPKFQDDIIIDLPEFLSRDMHIRFSFYNIENKKRDDATLFGTGSFDIFTDSNLLKPNGNYKVQIIDQIKGDTKTVLLIDIKTFSSIFSPDLCVTELLKSNFDPSNTPTFAQVIAYLPEVLDCIFLSIARNSNPQAFEMLLSIIILFPVNANDSRYEGFSKQYGGKFLQPFNHLMFYAKYCALRNLDHALFITSFFSLWAKKVSIEDPVRKDLQGIPFMLSILLKCLQSDKTRIFTHDFHTILENIHQSVFKLRDQFTGFMVNHYLALFYRDITEFCDRGEVYKLIEKFLLNFDCRRGRYDQLIFQQFLSNYFSPKTFLYCALPLQNDDYSTSFFLNNLLPKIEEGLANEEHSSRIFSIILKMLTYYHTRELALIAPGIDKLIIVIGRNRLTLEAYKNPLALMFTFIVCLYLIYDYDFNFITHDFGECCKLILEISDREAQRDVSGLYFIEPECTSFGHMNFSTIKETQNQQNGSMFNIHETWCRMSFVAQLICLSITISTDSIYSLGYLLGTLFKVNLSSPLKKIVVNATMNFIARNPETTFKSRFSKVYKIYTNIIKNLSPTNSPLIDYLWDAEMKTCGSNNRSRAFTLYGFVKKNGLTEEKVKILQSSQSVGHLAQEYFDLDQSLKKLNPDDDIVSELYAETLYKIAEFLKPSPDSRLKKLKKLGNFNLRHHYVYESFMTYINTAALILEYLGLLNRLPKVFPEEVHPALNFLNIDPAVVFEVSTDEICRDLPDMPGFCTSKYFSECGFLRLIRRAEDISKANQMFELIPKIRQISRPLLEFRRLWNTLGDKYKMNAELVLLLKVEGEKAQNGNYYRVEFQTGETYIYRVTQFSNLWQVSDRMKSKARLTAGNREVIVINDGEDLSQTKMDPNKFYVHVKAVEPYLTEKEKQQKLTLFELNRMLSRFYFDLPYSKDAQKSLEHLYLKRTIFTIRSPVIHILPRVLIPPEDVKKNIFSPIEYSCQLLQAQIDKIDDATHKGDIKTLQPLIQGSLLTQVNEGPKRVAEVFLTGAKEDKYTQALRKLFRTFLTVNQRAVLEHGKWAANNPMFKDLQEELENGMKRITSTIQPFLK